MEVGGVGGISSDGLANSPEGQEAMSQLKNDPTWQKYGDTVIDVAKVVLNTPVVGQMVKGMIAAETGGVAPEAEDLEHARPTPKPGG
jgi:hypothetical protein